MENFSAAKTYALFDTPAAKKIRGEISVAGAKIVLFPAAEIAEVFTDDERETLENLTAFDWLIFTDIYTVEFFLEKMQRLDFDLFDLDRARICAYGESITDRLRFAQIHADVISNTVKTADVFAALKNYVESENEFAVLKFLIFKEKSATPEITDLLKREKADARELAVYEIVSAENSETAKAKTLLRGGAIDEFIFTSPVDATNLAGFFPNENLADVLDETKLSASDNRTRQSLEEFRLL